MAVHEENLPISAEVLVVLKCLLFDVEFEGCRFFFLYSTVEVWSALDEYRIVSSSLLILSRNNNQRNPQNSEKTSRKKT